MIVYVIMGNDYPAGVFSDEYLAKEYVESKTREENDKRKIGARIYWKYYPFEMNTLQNVSHTP